MKPKWKSFVQIQYKDFLESGYENNIVQYSVNLSDDLSVNLSVNPPPEGAALRPIGPEVFMNGPGNFEEFFVLDLINILLPICKRKK